MASKLPYTKSTTFLLAGQTYADEKDAMRAAVEAVLGNAGFTTLVLKQCCALAPLLVRACDLGLGNQPPLTTKDE